MTKPMPPCYGMTEIFTAKASEIRTPEDSGSYDHAKLVCDGQPEVRIKPCPHRRQCAAQGLAVNDRHTVRCGLRLWVEEEREQLQLHT